MVLYSATKERSELLQPRSGLMQFPVGVALRDLADLAAGRAARVVSSQRCFPFSHPLFFSWACVIKISVSQGSDLSYFGAPVAEKHKKEQKEITSGRKGRTEWSICRQWFWASPVYHVILKLILWFRCVWHSGSSCKIGPYSTQHTTLIMETNGTGT